MRRKHTNSRPQIFARMIEPKTAVPWLGFLCLLYWKRLVLMKFLPQSHRRFHLLFDNISNLSSSSPMLFMKAVKFERLKSLKRLWLWLVSNDYGPELELCTEICQEGLFRKQAFTLIQATPKKKLRHLSLLHVDRYNQNATLFRMHRSPGYSHMEMDTDRGTAASLSCINSLIEKNVGNLIILNGCSPRRCHLS